MEEINMGTSAFFNKIDADFQETGQLIHYKVSIVQSEKVGDYTLQIGDFIFDKSDTRSLFDRFFMHCKEKIESLQALQDLFQNCLTEKSPLQLNQLDKEINEFIHSIELHSLISKIKENIKKLKSLKDQLTKENEKTIGQTEQMLNWIEKGNFTAVDSLAQLTDLWINFTKMLLPVATTKQEKNALIRQILPFLINNPSCDFMGDPVLIEDDFGLNTLNYIAIAGDTVYLEQLNKKLNGQLSNYINLSSKKQLGHFPLNMAIYCQNYEVAEWLIANGANINLRLDNRGETPLLAAINKNDLKMVDICLKRHDINTETVNIYGRTALHEAACLKDGKMIQHLLTKDEFKNLLDSQDIFGKTPLQLALANKNDEGIRLLLKDANVDVTKLSGYGVEEPNICQKNLIDQWAKYVEIKGGDPTHFVESEGECFGFSFLVQYYMSRGKKEELYRILNLFAVWDGSKETLTDAECVKGLSGDYKNFDDLMNQWINDVLWCMHNDEKLVEQTGMKQNQLLKIYETVKKDPSDKMDLLLSWGTHVYESRMNQEQLVEMIQLLSNVPNSSLSIVGGQHATSVRMTSDGFYHYFDPNLPFKVKPLNSAKELVKVIMDTKYLQLGYMEDEVPIGLILYRFLKGDETYETAKNSEVDNLLDHTIFSPNGLTPLHRAIILRDKQKIELLLKQDLIDINEKDQHNTTALDWAIILHQNDTISMLLTNPEIELDYQSYLKRALYINNDDAIKLLIEHYKNKNPEGDLVRELTRLLDHLLKLEDLRPVNHKILSLLLSEKADLYTGNLFGSSLSIVPFHHDEGLWVIIIDHMIDINHLDTAEGKNLLHHAIIRKNLPLIKMLIKKDADLTIPTSEGTTPFQLAKSTKDPAIIALFQAYS